MRFTRRAIQDIARGIEYHNSKTDFVTDLLDAMGYPEGFVVTETEAPTLVDRKDLTTMVLTLRRDHLLICLSALRDKAAVFSEANNFDAALACRNLAERVYLATHNEAPKRPKSETSRHKTRYDLIGEDDE